MKRILSSTLLAALLITGGSGTGQKAVASTNTGEKGDTDEKKRIQAFLQQVYKWYFTSNAKTEFEPVLKNDTYIGIDMHKHRQRLNELQQTGFFASEFLDNYDKIAQTIDKKLKNGELTWHVGEIPPFGNNAREWCICQDYPEDEPWNKIKFTFSELRKEKATLTWTWENPHWSKGFTYKIGLVRTGESWRISYMEGFDMNTYIPRDN